MFIQDLRRHARDQRHFSGFVRGVHHFQDLHQFIRRAPAARGTKHEYSRKIKQRFNDTFRAKHPTETSILVRRKTYQSEKGVFKVNSTIKSNTCNASLNKEKKARSYTRQWPRPRTRNTRDATTMRCSSGLHNTAQQSKYVPKSRIAKPSLRNLPNIS